MYPHLGVPGPAIGFLQEAVRWWDHWLKDKDTGMMDEPMVRAWMQDAVPPEPSYQDRPGHWVAEPSWPSPNIENQRWQLGRYGLFPEGSPVEPGGGVDLLSPLSVGMFAGKWASYAALPDLPSDQREEDGGSLVYETEPLEDDLEVFGRPVAAFEVAADKPVAQLVVRLSDVAPNGEATRVTYGLLNLTHRDGSEQPQPLVPGERYRVEIPLNGLAQSFPAGHRLRLSVSTSYWPLVWPAPEPATVTIFSGGSLDLPVRKPRADDGELRPFGEPEAAPELATTLLNPGNHHWRTIRDLETGTSTVEIINDQGTFRIDETGTDIRRVSNEWYSSRGNDVNSVRGETQTTRRYERGDWRVEVQTRTVLTSTPTDFVLNAQLDAYELDEDNGNPRVYSQNWQRSIPRQLV